jgi:hypothetical protein
MWLMVIAATWYSSGTFWAGAGAVAVVLVGVVTVIVTWMVGAPRRFLVYDMPVVTSLLASHQEDLASSELRVTFEGNPLDDAYFVSLRLENRSRKDIRSTDFDQSRPLLFNFGNKIVALVGDDTARQNAAKWFRMEDTLLAVEPTLIRRHEVIQAKLIMDGAPHLNCDSPLADITVRRETEDDREVRISRLGASIGALLAIVVGLGAVFVQPVSARLFVIGVACGMLAAAVSIYIRSQRSLRKRTLDST